MEHSSEDRGRVRVWLARVVALICFLLATTTLGQGVPRLENDAKNGTRGLETVYKTAPGTGILVFTVFDEQSAAHLDRQALIKLVNRMNQTVTWQTTEDESRGAFTDVPYGNYDVEVSVAGYLSEHKEIVVTDSQPALFDIVLRRDPAVANLEVADSSLSPIARNKMHRAVSALKSRNYPNAEKHLAEAYKSSPSNAELNFLLGYLYFQQRDFQKAANYLQAATTLGPHDAAALTLLGRTCLERQDYVAARSALERAVAEDAENWLPHHLLADAYLHQESYDKARDEAQVAITKGKKDASPAWLVLGQALINLGLDQQGIQALNTFLQESPRHAMAGNVRRVIADVDLHKPGAPAGPQSAITKTRFAGIDPLQALAAAGLPVKSWQPPGIDENKIALVSGVACPSEKVIEEAGNHVVELMNDVGRFAAVEDLFHQSLDVFGNPISTETRKYNYVASISEPKPGSLAVEEYRANKLEPRDDPDQIASTGFAALALVFHPQMRDTFAMRCEGLGDWHGQASWLVSFRQRDDKPNRMHSYKVNNLRYPVTLRGRAWITANKFQVVRIESEMVSPVPEIKLLSEHSVVDYGPIRFEKKNTSLWLPKKAEIYFDFQRHRYYRRHSFDHYMLFSVDAEPTSELIKKPNPAQETKPF